MLLGPLPADIQNVTTGDMRRTMLLLADLSWQLLESRKQMASRGASLLAIPWRLV